MTTSNQCPLCGSSVASLIRFGEGDDRVAAHLRAAHAEWSPANGACSRCVDSADIALLQKKKDGARDISPAAMRTADDYLVLPTPLRLNANPMFTGKGVTICFVDSGFSPHPDLVRPNNRILSALDLTGSAPSNWFDAPHDDNWHGTMTSVVCAGNGNLSNGTYRGIATNANLVLLKVKDENGISGESIARGIRWAIEHKDMYNIRIINLSVTDDYAVSYKHSIVAQAAEDAFNAGIVVVAAVGNDPSAAVKPPASSPNVIAVGGVNDHNTLGMMDDSPYHSTYGVTVDDFLKPELVAPSIWLAAPMLPKSNAQREAKALWKIFATDDRRLKNILAKEIEYTTLDAGLLYESVETIRHQVVQLLIAAKYLSADYQHADGTSFAAPIVCSVIAQMLEANPSLTPRAIRQLLLTTARRLSTAPVEQQGFGVLDAKNAVARAILEAHGGGADFPDSPVIDWFNQRIIFYYHNDEAQSVALAGSFNDWKPNAMLFKKNGRGIWRAEISMLPKGKHFYKFVVDNSREWIADPENSHREPDGFGGANSKLTIS